MNRIASRTPSFLSLFLSLGTLLCCALPSLLVLLGLGAAVASAVSSVPLLVTLSRHKTWVFAIAGLTIAATFAYRRWVAPRLTAQTGACAPDDAACRAADRWSGRLLAAAAGLYVAAFAVAYLLAPVLQWLDG